MSNPKAQAKYHEQRQELGRKLKEIENLAKNHRAVAGDNLHWGHTGDLTRVNKELDKIIAPLSMWPSA